MQLKKAADLRIKTFDEQIIVFDPATGQTHCLDANTNEIFAQLDCDTPLPDTQLTQFFLQDCQADEKIVLDKYLQAMLKNLLDLKLISLC